MQFSTDFEAHHFPNRCQTGNSLFRWRYRRKYHLFTSEIVTQVDDEWDLDFNPELWPHKHSQFGQLTKLRVDLLLPGMAAEGEEDIYRFADRTRKAFHGALQAKLKLREGGLKAETKPSRLRVVTNYASEEVRAATEATGLFEVDKMKVHGNCAMSLLFTYLETADIMMFQQFQRKFRPDHPFLYALREHVQEGGGLLLTDNRARGDDRVIVSTHPFPEIAVIGEPATGVETGTPELIVQGNHPITGGLADKTRFLTDVFEHKDHRHLSYEGRTFETGPEGQVCVRNAAGDPVVVAGNVGKGRVVMSGVYYGVGGATEGPTRRIYEGALRWLAGKG